MLVLHNFLTGTQINYQKSLFFDLMRSGDIYMGMTRSEPIWGFSTLVKIVHSNTWPTAVMGQNSDGAGGSTTKFYDINSLRLLTTGNIPTGSPTLVSIGYILKTDTASDISKYTFLDSSLVGNMELEYMNDEWARIRKINAEYIETILNSFSADTYDFYLFNYDQDITTRTQIQTVSTITYPEIASPVRLMYSTVVSAVVPTTAFGNNLIGDLVRTVSILGEVTMTGLDATFVTTGKGYVEDNNLQNATFFLTNAQGTVIQDAMKYISVIDSSIERSLVFSYPLASEAIQNSGRLKITVSANPTKLAIYPEKFSDGKDATDDTPAPLLLNYLKTSTLQKSMFDVLGLVKIEAERAEQITCTAQSTTNNLVQPSGAPGPDSAYFTINAPDGAGGETKYYVWFGTTSPEKGTDPTIGGLTGLKAEITFPSASAENVATAVALIINTDAPNLDAEIDSAALTVVTVKNVNTGTVTNAAAGTSGFTVDISNDVSFARRVDTEATETLLAAVPKVSIESVEVITIASNPDTTVDFAITNDITTATAYNFDLVRIIKKINTTTPTDKVYRQLFICYKPRIANGSTASALSYTGTMDTAPSTDPLFQNDSTNYEYDMGVLLYLVHKQPVFRSFLTQDETFTLMI